MFSKQSSVQVLKNNFLYIYSTEDDCRHISLCRYIYIYIFRGLVQNTCSNGVYSSGQIFLQHLGFVI